MEDFKRAIIENSNLVNNDVNELNFLENDIAIPDNSLRSHKKSRKKYGSKSKKFKLSKLSFSLSNLNELDPPGLRHESTDDNFNPPIRHGLDSDDEDFFNHGAPKKYKSQIFLKKSIADLSDEAQYRAFQLVMG